MTNLTDKLAALSEAATQGEWEIECDPYGNPFPGICPSGSPFEMASFTSGESGDENQANADFCITLVNAYRTGQLIVKPDRDAAIERMARALAKLHDDLESWKAWRVVAAAAYDAMFDGPAPTGNPLS
jgi:hypothetical protein